MTCIVSMADEYDPASPTLEIDGNNAVKQLSLDKENFMKPEKVKSRWRRNSEMEIEESNPEVSLKCISDDKDSCTKSENFPTFEVLEENLYLFERKRTKRKKEVRRMLCECSVKPNEVGCDGECLNRLLMIECGSRCATGEVCSNRRFQKKLYAKTEPFKTEKKGFGLKVLDDVSKGSFIIEYVGEVLNSTQFKQRVKQYSREKEQHYYFMALKFDEVIDARNKANASRFINHSCDPNCETQKWTVNGELRIGFFAKRDIKANEELTFDYQFERYGRQAQKCFCGSDNCKGYIGVSDEITVDIETRKENKSNKRKKSAEKEKEDKCEKRRDILEDLMLEEEIEKLSINGLRNKDETLMLARLMVRAEDSHSREKLLDIILGTTEVACLRLFLDYHGLTLFWSWMAYLTDLKLKKKILQALSLLPVPNKTMLSDSKILSVVEKWASVVPDAKEKICCDSFGDKEHENTKIKSCDTSDSETDGTSAIRTFSEGEHLTFSSSHGDKTLYSNCDVNMPKIINSAEETAENNTDIEESSSDNKTSDTNLRSDEESGDTLDDESVKDSKSHTTAEIANLAQNLLESWKDLKEVFRIPRREKRNEGTERGGGGENNSPQSGISNKQTDVKNQNLKQMVNKGNADEKSLSFAMEEKPEEIKVVYRTYTNLSKEEKRPSYIFPNKMKQRERRVMQNNVVYQYDGSSDYSNSENYQYSPPVCAGRNNLHHYTNTHNEYLYSNTSSPRPPLLHMTGERTPPPQKNMGVPSNIICAGPPQPVVNTVTVPPVLPNVMFPPPAKNFQLPFLSLPPPAIPPVASDRSAAIAPCQNNNMPPPSHLIGMPGVTSPIMPMQVGALPSEPLGYVKTKNEFCEPKSHKYMEPTFPATQEPEQTKNTYPSVEENGEPPKTAPVKLPPNWKTATDPEGNVYFYHVITRQTQWDPPGMQDSMDVDSTPTFDEPKEHKHETHTRRSHKKHSKRKSTTTAPADTSSREVVNGEIAKKIKELFRTKMSTYVVQCLNPYRKDDCKVGRITSNEDFKHLARKLTHFVMAKELKHCKNVEDLDANDSVKLKAKDYIRKYMDRYGPVYRKEKCVSLGDD